MKKKFAVVGLSLTLALTALCACDIDAGSGKHTALSKPGDVYGMGAVSTVKLLGAATSAQAVSKLSAVRSLAEEGGTGATAGDTGATANEAKSQAEKFNEYFTALDSFMGEDIVNTVSEANTDEKYPYETKLTINSKNFNGEAVQNILYYTETLLRSETEKDDPEEDDLEENGTESVYTLEGVMPVDGVDYYLEGARSFEEEDGETENELWIRAYADQTDKTSYVEMAQESSKEDDETETEYVYSVYSKGALIEETAVEFEKEREDNTEEVEYVLEFRKGEACGMYTVERETENGETFIVVAYDINGKTGSFFIRETDKNGEKQYEYSFEDDTQFVF